MYDINENKWSEGNPLPYALDRASSIVDVEENVAIILGSPGFDSSLKIFLFTRSNGMKMCQELEFAEKFHHFACSFAYKNIKKSHKNVK